MDVGAEGSATDWHRIRALTDDEIEAAVASDPDSYLLDGPEHLGRAGASYRYMLYRDPAGDWRWRLVSSNGGILAVGAQAYPTREALAEAISTLKDALIGARSEAA